MLLYNIVLLAIHLHHPWSNIVIISNSKMLRVVENNLSLLNPNLFLEFLRNKIVQPRSTLHLRHNVKSENGFIKIFNVINALRRKNSWWPYFKSSFKYASILKYGQRINIFWGRGFPASEKNTLPSLITFSGENERSGKKTPQYFH